MKKILILMVILVVLALATLSWAGSMTEGVAHDPQNPNAYPGPEPKEPKPEMVVHEATMEEGIDRLLILVGDLIKMKPRKAAKVLQKHKITYKYADGRIVGYKLSKDERARRVAKSKEELKAVKEGQ